MTKTLQRGLPAFLVALAVMAAPVARAATGSQTSNVSATVSAAANLTLGATTVTFANADPAVTTNIGATEGAVSVTVKARTSAAGAVTLTVLAGDDLKSGTDVIPISNVTWSATGTGFGNGTTLWML